MMARVGVFALNMSQQSGGVHSLIHSLMRRADCSPHQYLFITQRNGHVNSLPANVRTVTRPAISRVAMQCALNVPHLWKAFRHRRASIAILSALGQLPPSIFDSMDAWLWPHSFMPIPNLPRTTVICHDMIHRHHPDYFTAHDLARRGEAEQALERCAAILCPSQSTADDLLALFPDIGPRVHLFGECGAAMPDSRQCQNEIRQLQQRHGNESIFLYVAVDWPHKNHTLLLEAAELMRHRSDRPFRIVFVGHRRSQLLSSEIARRQIHDLVIDAGPASQQALAAYYRHATALVYPSLYEGFGIPLVEAMQCGLPIIASNVSSIPEVCGRCAILLPPDDPNPWAEQMLHLLEAPDHRRQLACAARQRGRDFSWEQTWRQIDQAIDATLARP
jgi:glycosyltransferase involved in cell wall biosynthesis